MASLFPLPSTSRIPTFHHSPRCTSFTTVRRHYYYDFKSVAPSSNISCLLIVAQKRLANGLRLNYTEAVALIATQILSFARVGNKSVAELMDIGKQLLGRGTRESTPCSSIRESEAIETPRSTTRRICSGAANRRIRNMQRAIPTTLEMGEFFVCFELHQQEQFLQKYNYDIVNDIPTSGRYEWVRVDN